MRHIFPADRIHPTVRDKVADNHRDIVEEVEAAVRDNDVVVVGMAMNPNPAKARRLLTQRGVPFRYLQYGSYFGAWRRRNALKMWTGWPTLPMVKFGVRALNRRLASGFSNSGL